MAKLLIYSHDTYGLGNIRRMLAIASHLSGTHPDLSILLISGSPMLHAFRIPARIDYVKLPCLGRDCNGAYVSNNLGINTDHLIGIRAKIIRSAVLEYAPDLMLVDKKPLGLSSELKLALRALRGAGRLPRMALLLRDILDAPEVTRDIWTRNHYYEFIEALYDRILVVGDPAIFDVAENYGFPESLRSRLRYCGYLPRENGLLDASAVRAELNLGDNRFVLVTAGGGADGAHIIRNYLEGLKRRAGETDWHSLVVCGSELAAADRRELEALAHTCPNVHCREFTNDIMSYMNAADAVVAMGGYNTLCELLTLKKKAIIVPRTVPVLEQKIRADRLAGLGLIQTVSPETLTPERLHSEVRAALDTGNVHPQRLYQLNMNGLREVDAAVTELLATDVARQRAGRRSPRVPVAGLCTE